MSPAVRLARLFSACTAALVIVAPAARPASADEGEHALSAGLGFARFSIPEHDGDGGALTIEYERGLSDAFWLRVTSTGAVYRGGDREGTGYTGNLVAGLTYVIDVLRYVPYLHAGVGALTLGGDALDSEIHPMAEIGIGLDILARRGLSYGLFARAGTFLDDSAFITAGLRLTWRWGFF
jgi:hypothetical protein